jgi:hypothetical protein
MTAVQTLAIEGTRLAQCVRSVLSSGIHSPAEANEGPYRALGRSDGHAKAASSPKNLVRARSGRQISPKLGSLGKERLEVCTDPVR